MDTKKDFNALAAGVKKAGYNGEKIVLMCPVDVPTMAPLGPVVEDMLRRMGVNAQLQSVDLNTMVTRRGSQAPVEEGGWSMFILQTPSPIMANPLSAIVARGLGMKGFAGNYEDPDLEAAITDWIGSTAEQERLANLNKVHQRLWDMMPIAPLANFNVQTAFRSDLRGYIPSVVPLPWNIRRT
jgi:peptide/nickel transport system substrate-binding protein